MDDKIKQLLQDLGTAINGSISTSDDVNRHIQRIRDEGYDLCVVLDATIVLNKQEADTDEVVTPVEPPREVQFQINVQDLKMLREMNIDPTRKMKPARKVAPLG